MEANACNIDLQWSVLICIVVCVCVCMFVAKINLNSICMHTPAEDNANIRIASSQWDSQTKIHIVWFTVLFLSFGFWNSLCNSSIFFGCAYISLLCFLTMFALQLFYGFFLNSINCLVCCVPVQIKYNFEQEKEFYNWYVCRRGWNILVQNLPLIHYCDCLIS